jgi:Mg-chelatase subunit ChlD
VAALVLAGAGPVREEAGRLPPESQVAVVAVLDVSASMNQGEHPPLVRARAALEALAREETGFRIGLVTFAGSALTRLPPTGDAALLEAALTTATVGLQDQGTALGTAIGLAGQRLRGEAARGRAVVLLTDGMSNTGAVDPETAAALVAEDGVPVHAVLLDEIPREGEARLRAVVQAGGGRLIQAQAGPRGVTDALRDLVPLRGATGPPVYREAWLPFLLAAGLLLGAAEGIRAWFGGVGP